MMHQSDVDSCNTQYGICTHLEDDYFNACQVNKFSLNKGGYNYWLSGFTKRG